MGRAALDVEQHVAPDHQLGEAALGRAVAATVATLLPRRSTEMRSATSSTSCSLCVMRMIEVPRGPQRAQHGEQLVDLLRGEHRGRLVEDQHLASR